MTSSLRRGPPGTFGLSAEAMQVVIWHNRHPLAVRIRPDHVQGMGWVLFPFTGPGDAAADVASSEADEGAARATLRERAMQRSLQGETSAESVAATVDRQALKAVFNERVLPGVQLSALAEFARVHGEPEPLAATAKPRREAKLDTSLARGPGAAHWLHLPTASIELGTRRTRVLLGGEGQVLGRRLFSRVKLAMLVLVPLFVVACAWVLRHPGAVGGAAPHPPQASAGATAASGTATVAVPQPASAAVVTLPASMPSAHVAGAAPAAASMPATVASPPVMPQAPAHAAASVPAASTPSSLSSAPTGGVKSIRPTLDPEVARAARRESVALRAASAAGVSPNASSSASPNPPAALAQSSAAAGVTKPATSSAAPMADTRPMPAAAAARGTVYALVARTTRSRAASEILLAAMAGESARATGAPRAEVLPAEGGYRASLWPFASREAAEQAQRRLQGGGLATQLVEF